LQPKIAKNSLKTPILGVQGRSRSSMLVPLESSSAVLAMIRRRTAQPLFFFRTRFTLFRLKFPSLLSRLPWVVAVW